MENQTFTPADAKAAYLREWRARNREHVSAYNKRYRQEHKAAYEAANNRYWQRKADEMNAAARNAAGRGGDYIGN